ncbi:small GTP-binding protein domain-containing protein [Clostridium cavendishii DSM 21758]|uniref:Small GTP-binding protein domain-containing protein n=1 Tax=Clostridium cavendishii DSM 21758 TaxID=1121302 RepID=A0A1M6I4G1_9CLOT|nr:TetM/TetW/TetO/TetS family tetracycline resistance ribosomal protection protein [Clostridium cavendishii]SHJ29309.1 small GTP-binding protein domain-containing protein [Clostridium cavendishii DSM 21758]
MRKTIGILAHVDAGKTTFAEQVLYHTNSIRSRGRVDHRDSFLDSHSIERERGITVFSDQAIFEYEDSTYYLIDTPGHIDFSCEMERAIEAMDYAVLIISALQGVQGHTETVWQLLRKNKIPTFIFINKMDSAILTENEILCEIKDNLSKDVCSITNEFSSVINEELIEFIAERDEELFLNYIEGKYSYEVWFNKFIALIKENKVFPCFSGSALQDIGIDKFLDKLHKLTYTDYSEAEGFGGKVYKIRHDDIGNKLTFIKALKGSLNIKQEIIYGDNKLGKINNIRIYNGTKYKEVKKVVAGDVFAVIGLDSSKIGDCIGNINYKPNFEMVPTLSSKVIFDSKLNVKNILEYFKLLEEEDPGLNIIWQEKTKEIQVHIMGIIQLEVLKQVVKERFNLDVEFAPCEIIYKETIENTVIGYGHFEPLGHYAEVHLELETLKRGSGIVFSNKCHVDDLAVGNQNLVRTHIFEKEHSGILTGSELTDIKITLLTGRAHNKHTSGGDFREATFRALRQGLEKANNILLEPYYDFKIQADVDYIGKIISDIQRLNGSFKEPEIVENKFIIRGRGPVSKFMSYTMEFINNTRGKGKISFKLSGYDRCHNEDEIIQNKNYNKKADIECTSSSIFCSKGQAFVVEGENVERYMHCIE